MFASQLVGGEMQAVSDPPSLVVEMWGDAGWCHFTAKQHFS